MCVCQLLATLARKMANCFVFVGLFLLRLSCVCVSVTGHISKEDGKLLCVCWSVSASTFELPDF